MASLVNTVDLIGDQALSDKMIEGSLTEFRDDTITNLPRFPKCNNIKTIDLPCVTSLGGHIFYNIKSLKAVLLRADTIVSLGNGWGFDATSCLILVPGRLVESYKTATNWVEYADRIKPIEDFTTDGTVSGELDESKI